MVSLEAVAGRIGQLGRAYANNREDSGSSPVGLRPFGQPAGELVINLECSPRSDKLRDREFSPVFRVSGLPRSGCRTKSTKTLRRIKQSGSERIPYPSNLFHSSGLIAQLVRVYGQ